MFLQIFEVVRILNRENSRGMINRFGWKRGCVGGLLGVCWGCVSASTKVRSAVSLSHFAAVKTAMVHSKTSLREASSLPGRRGCKQLEGWEGEGGRHLVCNYC